jgi:ABC-2 type transport system ATP-binding protein
MTVSADPLVQSVGPSSLVAPQVTSAPAIRVRHLWHRFGRFDVLRDVSFEVGHGEIFGFIGPNGAGKTTTIRIMATLLEPLAGRVEIDGYDVAVDPEAVRRIIGYMPDHAGVYDRVTVREYLEFFADAYKVAENGSYHVVDAVMELTDLTKLKDKLVATMSKGMKQRLQLARTLLHDPKVLILDEPASDLDPRARIEIRDLLVELRNMGKTVFLSSHILTELADVCTSVAILERGRLVVWGPISDIARRLEDAHERRAAEQAAQHANAPVLMPGGLHPTGMPMRPHVAPLPQQAQYPYPPGPMHPYPGAATGAAAVTANAAAGNVGGTAPMASLLSAPGEHPPDTERLAAPTGPDASPHTVAHVIRRRAKLKVLADLAKVQAALTGFPNVFDVSAGPGGTIVVSYAGDDQVLASVVRGLVLAGVAVAGVEPERNELERIFLEVTKGEVQ